jgi:hypothetical protein
LITTVACRYSLPVKVKWKVAFNPADLPWLEHARHSVKETLYGVRPQAVAHVPDFFVGKPLGDRHLGVGIT